MLFFLKERLNAAKGVSDVYGIHAISCARHSHLRDVLYQTAQQEQLGLRKEADGLLPGSDEHPADSRSGLMAETRRLM